MLRSVFLVAVVMCLIAGSHALFFNMDAGTSRCFVEDLPAETLVLGTYRVEYVNTQNGQDYVQNVDMQGGTGVLSVTFTDPMGSEVRAPTNNMGGRFAFTSHASGEHQVCLQAAPAGSRWFGSSSHIRVHFELKLGDDAVDYKDVAKKEHLDDLQLEVRRTLDKIASVRAEQDYLRVREHRMRDTSESTNSRVMWWSVAQVAILVVATFLQAKYLYDFFKEKKMV